MDVFYIVILLALELSAFLGTATWAYYNSFIASLLPYKRVLAVYQADNNFESFPFFLKAKKWFYFIIPLLYEFFLLLQLAGYLLLHLATWLVLTNLSFWILTIFTIIFFIITQIIYCFKLVKFYKIIKKIGIYNNHDAIKNFNDFENQWQNAASVIKFQIFKTDDRLMRTYTKVFLRREKRYGRKIERLIENQKINHHNQQLKLTMFFISKIYEDAYLMKRLKSMNVKLKIFVDHEWQETNFSYLQHIVINNFFLLHKPVKK